MPEMSGKLKSNPNKTKNFINIMIQFSRGEGGKISAPFSKDLPLLENPYICLWLYQIVSSTIDGNEEFVKLYTYVTNVNLVFVSDKIITKNYNCRIYFKSIIS